MLTTGQTGTKKNKIYFDLSILRRMKSNFKSEKNFYDAIRYL